MGRRSESSRDKKIAAVKLVTECGRSLLSIVDPGIRTKDLKKSVDMV